MTADTPILRRNVDGPLTRSKIIFLRPKVSQYTEKKFQTLIVMA